MTIKPKIRARKRQGGFTLVETIFYAAGLAILVGSIAGFLFYTYDWYRTATIAPRMDRIGTAAVDRMIREIRTAGDIDVSGSVFGSSAGAVSVTATVGTGTVTKLFALSSGRLTYRVDGGQVQYLTPADASISSLYLVSTSSPISKAVRIDLQISYETKAGPVNKNYTGLAILRDSY